MSTALSKEQWKVILCDPEVTKNENLDLFRTIYSCPQHKAFHKQLNNLKKDPRIPTDHYANRIMSKYSSVFNIELSPEGVRGKGQWWLFFNGWFENGSWIWSLKPELVKAIEEMSNTEILEQSSNSIDNSHLDSSWYQQDVLKLSVSDWRSLLLNEEIFHKEDVDMVLFVFHQENHQSTATEIGHYMNNAHSNKITTQNRTIAERIYQHFGKKVPPNDRGGSWYWNVIFYGNKEYTTDAKKPWIWVLRPNLVKAISDLLSNSDHFNQYCMYENDYNFAERDTNIYTEGELRMTQLYKYERNPIVRRKCIEKHGVKCHICGFDFGKTYGSIASGKIHVHHIIPLSVTKALHATNPEIDLIPVCPNCHYILHLKNPPYSPEEIKSFIQNPAY